MLLFSITAKFAKPVFCVLLSKIRWPQKKLFLKFYQPRMRSEIFAKPTGYRTMGNIFSGKMFTPQRPIRTNFPTKAVFHIFYFLTLRNIVWSSKPIRFWWINWTTVRIILTLRQKIRKVRLTASARFRKNRLLQFKIWKRAWPIQERFKILKLVEKIQIAYFYSVFSNDH